MKVDGITTRLALLTALAATTTTTVTAAATATAATGRCDAPFKTLSSDCRGAPYDAKTLCLVLDQRTDQPTPCKTGNVPNKQTECAMYTGEQCDVLSYKVQYEPRKALFQIQFPGLTSRALRVSSDAPPRLLSVSSVERGGKVSDTIAMKLFPPLPTLVDYRSPTTPPSTLPTPITTIPPTTRVDNPSTPTTPTSTRPTVNPPSPPSDRDMPTPIPPEHTPSKPGPVTVYDSDGNVIASESNQFVQAIGPLRLDSSLTSLSLVGGASEFGTRGKVAELRIDPRLLEKSPQVSSLSIANCNIGDQLATGSILSGMPTGLTSLSLRNTLMTVEPNDLSVLQNLRSLVMAQNYLTTLSAKVSLPRLTSLDLSDNSLKFFETSLPVLGFLNLNANKLNAIPSAVYAMTHLKELQLSRNPIVAIVVSTTQYNFLNTLRVTIDSPPVTPPQPVVYVPGPLNEPLPDKITNLILSTWTGDLSNSAVAVPVGTLVDLHGFPVWKLSDGIYDVFQAQQMMLTKSEIGIGGRKAVPYLEDTAKTASASGSKQNQPTSKQVDSTSVPLGGPSTDPTSASAPAGNSHMIASILTLGAAAVLVFAILVARHRQHRSKTTDDSTSASATCREGSSMASYQLVENTQRSHRDWTDNSCTISATEEAAGSRICFHLDAFGLPTWKTWRGSRLLASKRLIQSASTSERMAKFVNEVVIAADLDYPHIVRLVSVSWTNETVLQALYEYMPNGDLQTHLYNNTSSASLSWSTTKLQMAIDIVKALVYTHSFNPPLLHRDLRTRNVLLDDEMRPKLSKFGSARFASEQDTMTTGGVGSARWLAPEILSGSTDYDDASDMYAFGVLLCELDTHSAPYDDVRDANGEMLSETALMERVARGELRPALSAACPTVVRDLIAGCLAQDPATRPSAMQVEYQLRLLMREWKEHEIRKPSQ